MDTPCDNTARCLTSRRRFVRPPWCRERSPAPKTPHSMTQQSHENDTDVNNIVARFSRTGELPTSNRVPQYADVTALQTSTLTELIDKAQRDTATAQEFAAGWSPAPPIPDPVPDPVPTPTAPTGRPPAE